MKKSLLLLLVGVMGCLSAAAQSRGGLRINEVMVNNTGSIVDDYGDNGAWIELFNSTYAPLEISSVSSPQSAPCRVNQSTSPKCMQCPWAT